MKELYNNLGTNVLTPHYRDHKFYVGDDYRSHVAELTEGVGISGDPIYGLSVFARTEVGDELDYCDEKSELFDSPEKAREAYNKLSV